jgi:hypothetical protein
MLITLYCFCDTSIYLCALQIHKWQLLWCPIEERYYDTEDAMMIHYREDLGFIPRTLPLAAVAAAGVIDTLDHQVSAVLL